MQLYMYIHYILKKKSTFLLNYICLSALVTILVTLQITTFLNFLSMYLQIWWLWTFFFNKNKELGIRGPNKRAMLQIYDALIEYDVL